ncbi:MAG: T9SS type A sorting domain-containing protein [Balneolales bacterium]
MANIKYPLMSLSRIGILAFLVLLIIFGSSHAQNKDDKTNIEKLEIPRSGSAIALEKDKTKNYPIHVTDYLMQLPEAKEAFKQLLENPSRLSYQTQTIETAAEIGDTKTIKLYNFEETEGSNIVYDDVEMELRAVGELSEIWVEVGEMEPNKITQEVVDGMMAALEDETSDRSFKPNAGIIEINQELFGDPPDVDGSGKVQLFLANIQDGWDPEDGGGFVAGYFYGPDLSLTNPISNRGDIIYVNTYPGIYTDNMPASPDNRLSTIAHEYQHLIHANYRNLNLFQNEGQSEMAEILTGFDGRPMTFLNVPEEVSGNVSSAGLFRWRTDDSNDVLMDYERAGLLHSYLSERVGPHDAGRLTQTTNTGRRAYESILTDHEISWEDFITEFYVANWVNEQSTEDRFGYGFPQFSNIQILNPALAFDSSTENSWVFNRNISMRYGGANYTNWFGVKDLVIEVTNSVGIQHYIASRRPDEDEHTVTKLQNTHTFDGLYESIALISVNYSPRNGESDPGSRSFNLTANWNRTNLTQKEYIYYSEITSYVDLFGNVSEDPEDSYSSDYSLRITPKNSGNLRSLNFFINNRPQGITGDGVLRITLTNSEFGRGEGSSEIRVPSTTIATRDIPFSNLALGSNFVNVEATDWQVNKDQDYHLSFEIIGGTANSKIELLVDNGSDDQTNPDYYPARTLVYVNEPELNQDGWYRYPSHNNLVAGFTLIYPDESLTNLIDNDPPYAESFELEQNFPNPFNPTTTIQYNLVEDVRVNLEVYDILGRKVSTLVDEEQSVGSYRAVFDGAGMASGIYLYRLQAGDFTETGKMTLTK